jgi:hypothetical protein
VRGWLKGSIAVVVAVLVCAAMAPGASAAEAPEETGGVFLELTPTKDARVAVEVHPELGVVVVRTEIGPRRGALSHRQWGLVDYAARIPKTPIEGSIDLSVPGVLSIDGELTPAAGGGLTFDGSFHFTGKGGYLSFDRRHAIGGSTSGATAGCPEGCRASHPSLFDYINFPITFLGSDTQVLYSEGSLDSRLTRFQATHVEGAQVSNFDAHVLEWLPGGVAVLRVIEIAGAPSSDYKVSSTAEHPKSATLRPPAPFSGSAIYRSSGSIRSPMSGTLTGSLAVRILGVKVRLTGARSKASLINLEPGLR